MDKLITISNSFPDLPGIYKFTNASGDILYIGKATSLRDRVRSYFVNDIEFVRSPLIAKMVTEANDISFEKTDSVLEALILEAHLIKKLQPPFNTKEKDNKSFNYVVITKEDFPRVLTIRGRELEVALPAQISFKFVAGPFPHGGELKEAMKIIRRIFPWRDTCEPNQRKPCFNAQIGLCPGVCVGAISKQEYAKIVKNIILFFEGNKKRILKNLEMEMKLAAKNQEFEKAEHIKRQTFALNHIQDVALIKQKDLTADETEGFRIESYDVAHIGGTSVVGVMTVVEDGQIKKSDYRKFNIKENPGIDDTRALKEILTRRFNHPEWKKPNLVVVDGGIAQKNAAEGVLKQLNLEISVAAVTKDEKHKPREIQGDQVLIKKHEREILLSNAEAHRFAIQFHRKKRGKIS